MNKPSKVIYYLTGMGGRLATGLGQALLDKGLDVTGRELTGEFWAAAGFADTNLSE